MNKHWAAMVDGLRDEGVLSPEWEEPFSKVDRVYFVPNVDKHRAYELAPIVTQRSDDRRSLSSSSDPIVMAEMLQALDLERGQDVLEIGTGTGYNAALLAHRAGGAHVLSIEIDPSVARMAVANLTAAGFPEVAVLTGDGTKGYAGAGPYQRGIVTHAVSAIAPAWLEQLAPGGVLVVPWENTLMSQTILRLVKLDDGTAKGWMVGECAFMWDRAQDEPIPHVSIEDGRAMTTRIPPHYFGEVASIDLWIADRVPGLHMWPLNGPGSDLLFTRGEKWAVLEREPLRESWWNVCTANEPLWQDIEDALQAWLDADQPSYKDWPVTVAVDGTVSVQTGVQVDGGSRV
ncbi:protein-L-isoaspartate O-methyltransferase family protein [Salininema proteolyticum]|uniref:Protein-L-isoaspartate O-methyltransferase n=1 Tax=Salininema proteolyticum TaxID=1607685 RepID=A0ABV8U539_9ACTN